MAMAIAGLLLAAIAATQVPGPSPEPTPAPVQDPAPAATPDAAPPAVASPTPEPSPSPKPAETRPSITPPPPPTEAIRVAQLVFVEDVVERGSGKIWERIETGETVRTGDRIRVSSRGMAGVEFPWMEVTAGPDTVLFIPKAFLLSAVLEAGRIEMSTDAGEIVKLRTAEAEVRGRGRIIVRREGSTTLVAAHLGSARVRAARKTVTLKAGEGTLVRAGEVPLPPRPLPPPPETLTPGSDPLYTRKDEPVTLAWIAVAPSYHVQVLGIDSTQVLLEREVAASSLSLQVPWPGTFRWRVSSRNPQGLEGPPSAEGWICVYDW